MVQRGKRVWLSSVKCWFNKDADWENLGENCLETLHQPKYDLSFMRVVRVQVLRCHSLFETQAVKALYETHGLENRLCW